MLRLSQLVKQARAAGARAQVQSELPVSDDMGYITPEPGVAGPLDREGLRVSTRVPTSPKTAGTELESELIVGVESTLMTPSQADKVAAELAGQLGIGPVRGRKADSRLVEVLNQQVENLLWLYDQVPADIRERSQQWYDGANKFVHEWADQSQRASARGVAGAVAALSPQRDWYQNASLAARVLDVVENRRNEVLTPEMIAQFRARGGSWDKGAVTADDLEQYVGRTFEEMPGSLEQAAFIRLYDETYNPSSYSVVTPEGDFIETARRPAQRRDFDADGNLKPGLTQLEDGSIAQRVSWGSLKEVEKALSMLEDDSVANISAQLGNAHKIRNFYNNIIDPDDPNAVTIDTHAVAAALLRPLSGTSPEVAYNFGGSGSNVTGTQGSYGVTADAYRIAAAARGVLPRQMQSITWEAVRGLYTPGFKSRMSSQRRPAREGGRPQLDEIDRVATDFKKGRVTVDDFRSRVLELAGGINDPTWLRSIIGPAAFTALVSGMTPQEAEAAPFGTLARVAGMRTREAWHGSPHEYDQVDLSHMGSGEGAQAYGAGYYAAQRRGIAEEYRDDLSQGALVLPGVDPAAQRQMARDFAGSDFDSLEDVPREWFEEQARGWLEEGRPDIAEQILQADLSRARFGGGALYRLEIPDENLLDWDAPLSEQPEAVQRFLDEPAGGTRWQDMGEEELRRALQAVDRNGDFDDLDLYGLQVNAKIIDQDGELSEYLGGGGTIRDVFFDQSGKSQATGRSLYDWLTTREGGGRLGRASTSASLEASRILAQAGIPGIRYLDGASRDAGEGTRNYVIFDDANVNVVERNGEPVEAGPRGRLNWAQGEGQTPRQAAMLETGDYEIVDLPIAPLIDAGPSNMDVRNPQNRIGTRLEDTRARLEQGLPMDMAVVGRSPGDTGAFIEDGRHRLAAALELGEEVAPVIVPRGQGEALRRIVGGVAAAGATMAGPTLANAQEIERQIENLKPGMAEMVVLEDLRRETQSLIRERQQILAQDPAARDEAALEDIETRMQELAQTPMIKMMRQRQQTAGEFRRKYREVTGADYGTPTSPEQRVANIATDTADRFAAMRMSPRANALENYVELIRRQPLSPWGAWDAGVSVAAGYAQEIFGGLTMLGAAPFEGVDAAIQRGREVQEKLQYEPRTDAGRQAMEDIGQLMSYGIEAAMETEIGQFAASIDDRWRDTAVPWLQDKLGDEAGSAAAALGVGVLNAL